jgi:hypothetical protein
MTHVEEVDLIIVTQELPPVVVPLPPHSGPHPVGAAPECAPASPGEKFGRAWDFTRDEALRLAHGAAARAERAADKATRFLRCNPGPSLLALFGAGILLGMFLRRLREVREAESWQI